jgi:hypothetical protein
MARGAGREEQRAKSVARGAWRKEHGAIFPSFSENSDSSNIEPLQHSKFSVGYSIFFFSF